MARDETWFVLTSMNIARRERGLPSIRLDSKMSAESERTIKVEDLRGNLSREGRFKRMLSFVSKEIRGTRSIQTLLQDAQPDSSVVDARTLLDDFLSDLFKEETWLLTRDTVSMGLYVCSCEQDVDPALDFFDTDDDLSPDLLSAIENISVRSVQISYDILVKPRWVFW